MNQEQQTKGTDVKFKNLSDLKTTDFVRFLKMTDFSRRLEIAENHSQAMQKKLAYQLNEMINQRNDLIFKLTAVTEQRDRLAVALRQIKSELGVPQPEYPAPVANAVKIADEALAAVEGGSHE
jgi:hypothetical protein